MTLRTKFIDFDARRDPKTATYCVCCQKDIKADQKHRLVYVGDSMHAIHPDDVEAYRATLTKQINLGPWPMGLTCAKKLGLEWTIPPEGQ